MANGTGTKASQYKGGFHHLASWGFIVVGNEDDYSRTGASTAAALDFILKQNENPNSVFYQTVDVERVGVAGHSQGGVGAINAVVAQPNGTKYRAVFTASATSSFWGKDDKLGPEWRYDASKIHIPIFSVAGTGFFDAGKAKNAAAPKGQGICPLWSLRENYDAISETVPKVTARGRKRSRRYAAIRRRLYDRLVCVLVARRRRSGPSVLWRKRRNTFQPAICRRSN